MEWTTPVLSPYGYKITDHTITRGFRFVSGHGYKSGLIIWIYFFFFLKYGYSFQRPIYSFSLYFKEYYKVSLRTQLILD